MKTQIVYCWGYWRLDLGPSAGFERVGPSSQLDEIELPSGIYDIVLDVHDRATNAIARSQKVVYAGAPIKSAKTKKKLT